MHHTCLLSVYMLCGIICMAATACLIVSSVVLSVWQQLHVYTVWDCLRSNSCTFKQHDSMATAACFNDSQQLLSNSRHLLISMLCECTINAHDLHVCMQLLSTTYPDGTSLLFGNLFTNTFGNLFIDTSSIKRTCATEVQHYIDFCI